MHRVPSIKEPGGQADDEDEIREDSFVKEVKRAILKAESDSAKKTVDDADLDIRENPKLYMEIKERVEEMVDPNEEGAVNRLDTIRTRLLDYFQFYDCHNSENRTSDNIGTGVGLDDEEDAEEEDSSTPSVEDPDVAAKDAPNLHEYYRKYKKAFERKNKKKKLMN